MQVLSLVPSDTTSAVLELMRKYPCAFHLYKTTKHATDKSPQKSFQHWAHWTCKALIHSNIYIFFTYTISIWLFFWYMDLICYDASAGSLELYIFVAQVTIFKHQCAYCVNVMTKVEFRWSNSLTAEDLWCVCICISWREQYCHCSPPYSELLFRWPFISHSEEDGLLFH